MSFCLCRDDRKCIAQPGCEFLCGPDQPGGHQRTQRAGDFGCNMIGLFGRGIERNRARHRRQGQGVNRNPVKEGARAQDCQWRRDGKTYPIRHQRHDRLVAVNLEPVGQRYTVARQMRLDLPTHELATIVTQERQHGESLDFLAFWQIESARYSKDVRVSQETVFDRALHRIGGRGRHHDVKLAVLHAGDHVVTGTGRQTKIAVAQVLGEGDDQFGCDLGVEIVDDANAQAGQMRNIQDGQFRLGLTDAAQRVAGAVKEDAARGRQLQGAVAAVQQWAPERVFKVRKLLRGSRKAQTHQSRPFGDGSGLSHSFKQLQSAKGNAFCEHATGTPFRGHSFQKVELVAALGQALAVKI